MVLLPTRVSNSCVGLFVVPSNSVGIPVPTGVKCCLSAKGNKLLESYIHNLREANAPDAEVEAVTALARYGGLGYTPSGDNVGGGYLSFMAECEYTHMTTSLSKSRSGFLRAKNFLRCFLGLTSELEEIPDRYGDLPSKGRERSTPQIPKMTIEVHCPSWDKEVRDSLSYEAAPEHPRSVPLRNLTSIAQIADLTCDELDQYLRFYVFDVSEDDGHDTKLELLKKELGIDCVGNAEFNGESSTRDARRAVRSYMQLVGSKLTSDVAAIANYSNVQSVGEKSLNDLQVDVKVPCEMLRQRVFALHILEARYNNRCKSSRAARELVEIPDHYGNVPSRGRNEYIPAQVASRTPLRIPGVEQAVRYVVLSAIPEHPIVKPLPALTGVFQVMSLTPHQVNQYLKFYCVKVPEDADFNQRLALLKVELSIDHLGPALIGKYPTPRLAHTRAPQTQLYHEEFAGMSFASMGMDDMDVAEEKVVEKKVVRRTATKTNVDHSGPSRKKRKV